MEINLDRTSVVFAAVALSLWLVVVAPDEVQQGFLVNILAMLALEVWMRGQDQRP